MKEFENNVRSSLNDHKQRARSAWEKGVLDYAMELFDEFVEGLRYEEIDLKKYVQVMNSTGFDVRIRNGASNWNCYSWSGSSLVYNEDIAKRLCTPSELRKTKNGMKNPNGSEDWIDVQGRALAQAATRLFWIMKGCL